MTNKRLEEENKAKLRECRRIWIENNRDKHREIQRVWRQRNPTSVAQTKQRQKPIRPAHSKLQYAINKGDIIRPSVCQICGETKPLSDIQGHHDDYSKPFSVVWMCRKCHATLHKLQKTGLH